MTALLRRRAVVVVCGLLLLLLGYQRRVSWRDELLLPGIAGDSLQYFTLAAQLENHHTLSFDGTTPSWSRLPGYPLFLWATTSPSPGAALRADPEIRSAEIAKFLQSCTRVNQLVDLVLGAELALLAVALGAGPGSALLVLLYWMIQPWSAVFTAHPLCDGLAAALGTGCLCWLAAALSTRVIAGGTFQSIALVAAGSTAGLTALVRPDGMILFALVIAATLLVAIPLRPIQKRLKRTGGAVLAIALTFSPWPIRNVLVFAWPHPLAGFTGVDEKGTPFDRVPSLEWLRTWPPSPKLTTTVAWAFPARPITSRSLPEEYFGTDSDRANLEQLIAEYNAKGYLDAALNAKFHAQALTRRSRYPLQYYVTWPLLRIRQGLFAPHDGIGMRTLTQALENRDLWSVLQNVLLALGLVGCGFLWAPRRARVPALLLTVLLLSRLAAASWMPNPEPRYLLSLWPLLFATAATLPRRLTTWQQTASQDS